MFKNSSTGILLFSKEGRILETNNSLCTMLGYPAEYLINSEISKIIHPHDLNDHFAYVQQLLHHANEVKPNLYRLLHKEGYDIWVLVSASVLMEENDDYFLVFNLFEVSNHVRYQQQYNILTEHSIDLISRHRTNGIIKFVSSSCKKLLGYEPKELLEKSPYDIFHPEDISGIATHHLNILKDIDMNNCIYRILHKNGHYIWFDSVGKAVKDEKGNIIEYIIFSRDISERIKTEELLRKSERLSVVGQMAAGVAHEIRNPLTSIKGFMKLLKTTTNENNQMYMDVIQSELDRIEMISNEFMMVAKPLAINFYHRDLRNLLAGVIDFLHPKAVLNNVQMRVDVDSDLPMVKCDDNQLKQVFINIFKNAIEAMPSGGEMVVKAMKLDQSQILIRCTDFGCGISPERLPHLGEPFYSLKEKGTGLGLMVCYRIIEEHKGRIFIESEVEKGTTVEVTLPV